VCSDVRFHQKSATRLIRECGSGEAMHVFDYIAIGVLIVCTLLAVAMVLPRRNS
jgi:hypothetical protein